jgi:hypothetical protein
MRSASGGAGIRFQGGCGLNRFIIILLECLSNPPRGRSMMRTRLFDTIARVSGLLAFMMLLGQLLTNLHRVNLF